MVVNNPNNWHWVDKNCIDWSKKYFADKLVGLSGGGATISKVSSVEGDVEVCQRKGKVISLFDLKLVMEFKTEDNGGSITLPELAYDSDEDSLQFDITMFTQLAEADKVRSQIKAELIPVLKKALLAFGPDLIHTHSSDIQLESDKVNSQFTKANQEESINKKSTTQKSTTTQKTTTQASKTNSTTNAAPVSRGHLNTSTLHLEPVFNTTAEQLYITLLDPARVAAWSRSPPQMQPFPQAEGAEYALFGGSVSGKFIELKENAHIVQSWRLADWRTGHYATLDIKLVQGAGETTMMVNFSGIPVGEEDRVRNNFEEYYARSIKITFGFGAVL